MNNQTDSLGYELKRLVEGLQDYGHPKWQEAMDIADEISLWWKDGKIRKLEHEIKSLRELLKRAYGARGWGFSDGLTAEIRDALKEK